MNNRGQVALSILAVLIVIALVLIIVDNRQGNMPVSGQNILGIQDTTCDYQIDSCKNSGWESNKVYCLNKSIIATSNCFNIDNNSVTLDCKEYSITGSKTGSGIINSVSKGDITIQNCIIQNFSDGIHLMGVTSNNEIISNTISKNLNSGIYFDFGPASNIISNNAIYENAYGIRLFDGSNSNLMQDNNIYSNSKGIFFENNIDNCNITKNNLSNNTYGIYLESTSSSDGNFIYNNYFNNPINAEDSGNANKWNITYSCTSGSKQNILDGDCIGGNYWNNYAGLDNGNGVYPYNITPWNRSGDGYGDTQIPYNDSGRITIGGDYHPLLSSVAISSAPDTSTPSTSEFWTETYTLSSSQFHAGYTLKLNATQRVRVSIDGDNHYIGVISITDTHVFVNISSIPQQANISDGHSKQFDVNNDSLKDISVSVNEISNYTLTNYTANLTIKLIENETVLASGVYCGDGKVSTGELCDGTNLSGSTCASVLGTGYTGTLTCSASCTFNTSKCNVVVTNTAINNLTTPAITSTPAEESNATLWVIIIVSVILVIAIVIFFILRRNRAGSGQSQVAQPSPFISRRPPAFPPSRIPQLPPRPIVYQPARVPIVQQPRPVMSRQQIQPRPVILPPGTKIPQMQPSPSKSSQTQSTQGDLPPSPPR